MILLGVFVFFVSFYRLSLFHSNLYLSIIPSLLGVIFFIANKKNLSLNFQRNNFFLISISVLGLIYCIILDFFQNNITLESSFSFRIITIVFFSFFSAYFLNFLVKSNLNYLDKIIKYGLFIQLFFFFLTFISPTFKSIIYGIFGLSGSVNLLEHNLNSRGFGLSSEINFMTPFLMIYLTFLIFSKNFILKLIVSFTQVINSNMALLSILLGLVIGKIRLTISLALVVMFSFYFLGEIFVKNNMPRLYDEFFVYGGARTINSLKEEHLFLVEKVDFFSFLFGFQKNVSSSVSNKGQFSDMGWVVIFNYGGFFLILLLMAFVVILAFSVFKNKFYALIWILIAIIFNTKGMIIGMNGYFFLSFLFLLSKRFK